MKQIIRRVAALIIGLGLGGVALAGLESVTNISDLNASWPLGSDLASTSDDHIRNIKTALKNDFPNITGAVTVTQAQLNAVGASGVTGAANPSGSVGLTAVNGSATTFMRSDGAPPLSQSISPTWTGTHTFSGNPVIATNNGKNAYLVNSAGTNYGTIQNDAADTWSLGTTATTGTLGTSVLKWVKAGNVTIASPSAGITEDVGTAGATSSASLRVQAASGAAVGAIQIYDSTNSAIRGYIGGGGLITGQAVSDFGFAAATGSSNLLIGRATGSAIGTTFGPNGNVIISAPSSGTTLALSSVGGTGTALTTDGVDATAATGTFTATYTGFTAGTTCTATWSRIGKLVLLFFCTATGTSNSSSFTMTGLPSAIQPASLTQTMALPIGPVQNASIIDTTVSVTVTSASGTVTFLHNGSSSGWTNSGTKGFSSGATVSYLLN